LWNDFFDEKWISFTVIVIDTTDLLQSLTLGSETRTIAVPEPAKKVRLEVEQCTKHWCV
jgi:hypothetical protein